MVNSTVTTFNKSVMPYNTTQVETFQGLFVQSNQFMGGGMAYGILLVVWAISFYAFSDFPVRDSLLASTWTAFLASSLLSLMRIIDPAFTILLGVAVVSMTAYSHTQAR